MNTEEENKSISTVEINYIGPLPPPEALARYEQIKQGLADRIIQLAENEAKHRHDIDRTWLKRAFSQQTLGQFLGFFIAVIAILAGVYVAIKATNPLAGSIAGSIIGSSGVIGLASIFVLGKKEKDSE